MKINRITSVALGLMAFVSCSSVNANKEDTLSSERPRVIFYKSENTNLRDYTEEYSGDQFDFTGEYVYRGEQLDNSEYIDSETIIYRTYVNNGLFEFYEYDDKYSKYPDESNDEYNIEIREVANPKYREDKTQPEMVKKKIVFTPNKKILYITLKSKDTGEERTVVVDKPIKEIDPIDVVNKAYPEMARYKDIKKGLDNGRISLDIFWEPSGLGRVEDTSGNQDLTRYEDLDDMVGEVNVKVRVRVNGFASERDSYVDKKIVFGDKLEDYKYEELLADLSKRSLKYSKDGLEVLGGFDEYKTNRLLASLDEEKHGKNNDELSFVTRVLDQDPEKPTVGTHTVIREIIKDGKVVYSKKDKAFIGFNGPTVAITDNSFFDLSDEVEARTYRQTPYYTDPKFDLVGEAKETGSPFAKLARTHGATVIGAMVDELSYGKSLFWKGFALESLGVEGNGNSASRRTDEKIFEIINQYLDLIVSQHPERVQLQNIANEIRKKSNTTLKYAVEGKRKPFGQPEIILSDEEKQAYKKEFYDYVIEKAKEVRGITELDKLGKTDINFHVVSIGRKDGRGVKPNVVGDYLPKVLELNKNIKLVNMSYGADANYNDFANLESMSDEDKQKAAQAYNERALYRFLIQAWLKAEKEEYSDLISKNYPHVFNAIELYDYFKNKESITKEDFDKLIKFRKDITKYRINNAVEFSAANHDILMIRSIGNTYNAAKVDLTSFRPDGTKRFVEDPNLKYNNNFGSVPSVLNYIRAKKALENGEDYTYDYSYRKNILNVVGVVDKNSVYGRPSTDDFLGYGLGTYTTKAIKEKAFTSGMYDYYIELVKELNKIRKNPNDYPEDYLHEIESQIEELEYYSSRNGNLDNRFSLTRAGESKLWTLAAEGEYVYVSNKDSNGNDIEDDINYDIALGSSFAAPRVTAVGSLVQKQFPWMSAHQIKQTLLTTALDDFRIENGENGTRRLIGLYGVDENIGWGLLSKERAINGPARFVKALTHETGNENFVANIPYGTYVFANDIQGAFDPLQHMVSRGALTEEDLNAINSSSNEDEARKTYQDKIVNYVASLPFEERELFVDAGLEKLGKGTLVLQGRNTYSADTDVKEGTLVLRNSSKSDYYVSEGAKLKLDLNYKNDRRPSGLSLDGNVYNKGELYSYSTYDVITKNYVPYQGSRTFISPVAKLSVGNLDLTNISQFNIEIYKNRGIDKKFSRFNNRPVVIFEAKTPQETIYKVRLGVFPVSTTLSLDVAYKNGTLTASIMKGGLGTESSDKRPTNTSGVPFGAELLEKLKEKREQLDREAEERANGSNNNSPETGSAEELAMLEDGIDSILYANATDLDEMDGTSLADSLTISTDLLSLKAQRNVDIFNENFKANKWNVFGNLLNELTFEKEGRRGIVLKERFNGFNLGLAYNTGKLLGAGTFEYINGSKSVEDIDSTNLNSIGFNGLVKYNISDFEFRGVLSETSVFKTVTKGVLFANSTKHKQNQHIVSLTTGLSYNARIDKNIVLRPYVDLDSHVMIFEKYDEEKALLGLKYDTQAAFKMNMRLGFNAMFNLNDKFTLGLDANYTKWITNKNIDLKVESTMVEELENKVKSIEFKDHLVRLNAKLQYKPTDSLTLSLDYSNKNLKTNNISLGLNYSF